MFRDNPTLKTSMDTDILGLCRALEPSPVRPQDPTFRCMARLAHAPDVAHVHDCPKRCLLTPPRSQSSEPLDYIIKHVCSPAEARKKGAVSFCIDCTALFVGGRVA